MVDTGGRVLSQRVSEELEARIVDRVYPPGTHLVEDVVAADMSVSRTPVREAFRVLQRAGWLDLRPHSGAFVRYPTVEDVREVFELRMALEERATQLAAQRAQGSDVKEMARIIERGTKSARRKDVSGMAALNNEFHAAIAMAARNELLRRILEDLGKRVRWHFAAVATVRGEDSWREHGEILAAVMSGDAVAAARLAVEHSSRTQSAYLAQLIGGDVSRSLG